MSFHEVFVRRSPVNNSGKSTKNCFYSTTFDRFVNIPEERLPKSISKGQCFIVEGKKCKYVRKKKGTDEKIRDEFERDSETLKRLSFENKNIFENGAVLVLSSPHKHVHEEIRLSKTKAVFDVLNNKFYYMTTIDYNKQGLNKLGRGHVVEKTSGKWNRVPKNRMKFDEELDEIGAQKVQSVVEDNYNFWKEKNKFNVKCMRCIHKCKQLRVYKLQSCRQFETQNKEEQNDKQ